MPEPAAVSQAEVVPRPAATVVLLRPGPAGPEVLLGRRPPSMAFAPDVHVFPGGRVDSTDSHPSLVARSVRSPEAAAVAMGGDMAAGEAVAAHIAAIREAFEESGVLLAHARSASRSTLAAARAALVGGEIGFAALAGQLDLTLRTDRLVPLSRWVTPRGNARRFDARFFAAALPEGAVVSLEGDEVVEHAWLRPVDALDAMAAGELALWPPTSTTLQQLSFVDGFDDVAVRLAAGSLGSVVVEAVGVPGAVTPDVVRIEMPAGGGVAGQGVNAYLVGRSSFVLVDPGDPTGPALDRALALAAERGGSIRAVALTHVDPDHAAGAPILADEFGIEILVGPGGGRPLSWDVREVADGDLIDAGDVPLRVVATPGPRPDHLAFLVGEGEVVLTGDLEGPRGRRSVFGPPDEGAWAASRARLDQVAGGARRLGGHGSG